MPSPAVMAAVLVAALATMGATAAAVMPAKNPGFEAWDAQGRPEGWRVGAAKRYLVTSDCAAGREGCALRLEGRAEMAAGEFIALTQPLGAGDAAGRGLRLSGWIRTADVAGGWAGLWLRVDLEGKPLLLENMVKDGPRGTTGWQRFEVRAPVAANATLVSFGVLLVGRGTAWFDDLALEVDTAVAAGNATRTQVIYPPRPRPSQRLADDASHRLPPEEVPRVRQAWRVQARDAAHPIRSLFSDDFSDLQFLKPLLAGKRVVQLGESAHGVAEFNWMKSRLVRFLHRELGFDVVAFESSLTACDIADARMGTAAPADVMRDCIFGVWHSTETLGLFEYLGHERAVGRHISLAGFDTQNSSRARPEVSARLVRHVDRVDPALAERIRGFEVQLVAPIGARLASDMKAAYAAAAERLAEDRKVLRTLHAARPVEIDLAIQELRSRVRLVEQLAGPQTTERVRVRDEGMAANLDFLLDHVYPGRKVIVWAHNFHVAREQHGVAGPNAMGAWVARRRGAEVYTVGLYMGRGVAMQNDRRRYEIVPPGPDSLEAVLASAGWKMSFFDLAHARPGEGSWMVAPMAVREWGVNAATLVPARAFDALIYIDTVTPPEYL